MANKKLNDKIAKELENYVKKHRGVDLMSTYLFYLERANNIQPVVFLREKKIYKSEQDVIDLLESQGRLWRETEIKIQMGKPTVNKETKRVYICPFSGKVFGDNTCPNPQDAIYEWVSTCPENTERVDGMRIKRYYVSDDPEVVANYAVERKKTLTKKVYSFVVTGKLYNSKEVIIEDFKAHHLKPIDLPSALNQNRFEIQEDFLAFIESQLEGELVAQFLNELSRYEIFLPHVERWRAELAEEEEGAQVES